MEKSNYNQYNLNSVKIKLIELTNINMDYVDFIDINVSETQNVHVMIIDDYTVDNKPDVVFIHGLTGSSMMYFKNFKELSKYFRIIALDLPGMGLSIRTELNPNEYDFNSTEEYFVSGLDKALSKIGVSKAHFISTSFGGYVSCLFTLHHREKVLSLTLISPVGISSYFVEIVSTKYEDFFQRICYKLKKPPTDGIKMFSIFAHTILENLLVKKFRNLKSEEEVQVSKDLVKGVYAMDTSSEKLIYFFFNCTLQAYKPMMYYYEKFEELNVDFIYGDNDWNPIEHAEEVIYFFKSVQK